MCSQQRSTTLDHGVLAVGHSTVSDMVDVGFTERADFVARFTSAARVSRHRNTVLFRHRCAHSKVPYEAGPCVLAAVTTPKVARTAAGLDSAALAGFSPPQVHIVRGPEEQATWCLLQRTAFRSATPRILVSMASGWITPSRLAKRTSAQR